MQDGYIVFVNMYKYSTICKNVNHQGKRNQSEEMAQWLGDTGCSSRSPGSSTYLTTVRNFCVLLGHPHTDICTQNTRLHKIKTSN